MDDLRIYMVKFVGNLNDVTLNNGEKLDKRNIVVSSIDLVNGEKGVFHKYQDYAIDLKGEMAKDFKFNAGDYLKAELNFYAYEHNGEYRPVIKVAQIQEL